IERDAERHRELRLVLPTLKTAWEQQSRATELERTIAARAGERRALARRLEELDRLLADLQEKRRRQDVQRAAREEYVQAITKELQTLSVALLLLRQIQRGRASL